MAVASNVIFKGKEIFIVTDLADVVGQEKAVMPD